MVSVIVPVYNAEKYIMEFLKNIKNQTFKDFEIIFVDDGSQDNSLNLIKEVYQEKKLQVKYITQNNSGVSAARNKGIEMSSKDFLCFCDIDDKLSPYYLEHQLECLNKHNVDLVIGKQKFFKTGEIVDISQKSQLGKQKKIDNQEALLMNLYGKLNTGCCSLMVAKRTLTENDIKFPVGYKYNEDLYTLWKIIYSCKDLVLLDEIIYFYRGHENSAMMKFDQNRVDGLILMKQLLEYFEKGSLFYKKYEKFGPSRIAWSLAWQAAIFLNFKDYIDFINENRLTEHMKELIKYPDKKVQISSILLRISPLLFRGVAIAFQPQRFKN